ncbi:hypothetical protein ASG83_08095 [Yonghaparkia sp. Soil809]|nr:hypothetical protein ASC54_08265 [Yonghaparkia sp. Root332]KRF30818.1 hypothetical protein ASG83_08095 [Yonghaparkia sp. Soil809]
MPEWVRWIPAVLLSAIIIAVVAFAASQGPRLAAGPGPAETNEVDDLNFSVFSEEGLAFIDEQRIPRLDLRDLPVETEPLGLPADGELVIGPHPQDLDYRLVLLASGGEGGARFTTVTFTITTKDGEVRELRVAPPREVAVGTFRDVEAFAVESAERFGYPPIASGTLLDLVLAAQESGEPETTRTASGDRTGLPTQLEITCTGDAFCQPIFVIDVG